MTQRANDDAGLGAVRQPQTGATPRAAGAPQEPAPRPPAPDPAGGRRQDPAARPAPAETEQPTAESEQPAAEPDQPAAEPRPPAAEELLGALAEAERARDEYLDHLRRERAAFENFRKRTTRERMDALDRGAEALVANLLGVLDHFGFALEAAEASEDDQLAKGVQMVHTELMAVLRQAGLEEIPGVGEVFDPACHEAMMQVESDEPVEDPVVVEVLRPGYRFKGRVLRPASVKVAR